MNACKRLTILSLILLFVSMKSAAQFEGTVTSSLTGTAKNKTPLAMATEMSSDQYHDRAKPASDSTPKFTIQQTGKTQTFLGHLCRQVLFSEGERTLEVWGTTDLAPVRTAMKNYNSFERRYNPEWNAILDTMGLYPLKSRIKSKELDAEITVTAIDKTPVSDMLFTIPDGYTKKENRADKKEASAQTKPQSQSQIDRSKNFTIPDEPFAARGSGNGTDVDIVGVSGENFNVRARSLAIGGGAMNLWCNGAKHRWIGKLTFSGYTFDSDLNDPLEFEVSTEYGYVYTKGKGHVTKPDGTVISLPASPSK